MIDEDRTLQLYGYTSNELKPHSGKHVVAVCEECGTYRVLVMKSYRDLCNVCGHTAKATETARKKMKVGGRRRENPPHTLWERGDTSITRDTAMVDGVKWKKEHVHQVKYCHKFDDVCREKCREKYERLCFLCGKNEEDNGQRLDVHHVDMSKSQGCDGEKWKLVPLCQSCHSRAHTKLWQERIEYLLMI